MELRLSSVNYLRPESINLPVVQIAQQTWPLDLSQQLQAVIIRVTGNFRAERENTSSETAQRYIKSHFN
jgi:hypothetical protein